MKAAFAEDLHRRNSDHLGFIPRSRLDEYEANDQILIQKDGSEPCGYLIFGKEWPFLNIYQACIEYDVRRRHHGMEIVDRLEKYAKQNHSGIYLRCREGMSANDFWEACGYEIASVEPGGIKRGKQILRWVKEFDNPRQMELFK